jgi:hypothetical protein
MREENRKVVPFIESIAESTTACLVTMAQGNIFALTLGHLVIASQTGVIAGVLAAVTVIVAKVRDPWAISALLGALTAIVDYFVHPGMFGPAALEAIVTGLGAALLSYLVGTMLRVWRLRRDIASKLL